jgi:DNA modification methylase
VHLDRSETSIDDGEDDLRLLRSLPAESVDLVYLDPPFFSSWISEGSWAYQAELTNSSEDRWKGIGNYMGWVSAALDDMHRILKPTGALLLICDRSVGLYVRVLLDELIGPRNLNRRMTWTKVISGSEHHYLFYYHKSAEIGRHGNFYTVIRRQSERDCSLVAFSFMQSRRVRRTIHRCDGNSHSPGGAIPGSILHT